MHWIIALSAVDPLTSVFGRHLPHSLFGAKQFSCDMREKIWGKSQSLSVAFVVNRN